MHNSTSSNSQSTLLRTLIRTPQTSSLTTKKDAPLYDLLQNLDSNEVPIYSTNNNTNHSVDPLEQYLTPTLSQLTKASVSSKDDYLAALLSSDPQQPNEISFVPMSKQPTSALTRSSSTASDSSRIAAIVNDLFNSTTAAAAAQTTTANSSNDDFLSLLENKDFLEVK
jgi:hypothetical protein